MLCFFAVWFCCQSIDDVSPYVCSDYFSSVAIWPQFWNELLTRLTICTLCVLTVCYFSYFPFWVSGRDLGLIAQVPGHCLLFTFKSSLIML